MSYLRTNTSLFNDTSSSFLDNISLPDLNINTDHWINTLSDKISTFVPIPGFNKLIKGIVSMLSGCASSWDKQAIVAEGTKKAQAYIAQALIYLNDKSIGDLQKRVARADKYMTYVFAHHMHYKRVRNCGKNKHIEAVKAEIAKQWLEAFRQKWSKVMVLKPVSQRYYEPRATYEHKNITHYVTYRTYQLKSNASEIIEKLKGVPTDLGDNSGKDKDKKGNTLTYVLFAFLGWLLFTKKIKI